MEVLKIKANQLFANYRKPMTYNFIDTYPLPPLSTVKGWFHNIIEAKEYIPVSMSIQGNMSGVVQDMQTLIKFDRVRKEKEQIILDGFNKALSKSPTYVANIYDIDLVIYIHSDKIHLEKFKEKIFEKDYTNLGRYEDLLRIDYIDFVNLEEKKFSFMKNHSIDYGIYLSKDKAKEAKVNGINYRLNFKYEVIEGIRYFNKINVVYIDNSVIESGTFLFDNDADNQRVVDLIGDYE